jgi:YidC/Oxa1 family membrane protein insertase
MDRKGIFLIILAVVGMASWEVYYLGATAKAAKTQAEAAAEAAANAPAVPAPAVESTPATVATAPVTGGEGTKPAVESAAPEKRVTLSNGSVEYDLSNLGGGISRATLLKHHGENHSQVVLNGFGNFPIGAIGEIVGESAREPFSVVEGATSGEVTFERTDARQLQVTKKFVLPKLEGADNATLLRDEYRVQLDVVFTNRGTQPIQLPGYFIYTGSSEPVHQSDLPTYTGFSFLSDKGSKFHDVNWFSGSSIPIFGHPERSVFNEMLERVRWAAVSNQYFATLVTPFIDERLNHDVQLKHAGRQVWAKRFDIDDAAWLASGRSLGGKTGVVRHGVQGAIGMPGISLQPNESFAQTFYVYTGPREYGRLHALGNEEAEVMNFGMFGIVSKTLLRSMNILESWFNSYAWAIIVLTLVIKTLMWPLQNKATKSMKRMQLLQPKMTELREKYKDDPTRMNTELMGLYKTYSINPLAGCFPMLIQIPIFFGFYNMLGVAVELRNSSFLWVHDLSQPDTVGHLFGFPINVLPLCMAVTMFVQMAIQPKSGDPAQQRVFMFMPLIFVFFCYNFASALALYWTVQNIFSIVQLYATRNQVPPTLESLTAPKKKKARA